MTALWTASEAARATGGTTTARWTATGVSIDSRTLAPGDLFVALEGPCFDGHAFVAAALAAGAAAGVVARRPEGVAADAALLEVADTRQALDALGRAARARTAAKVCAVTGSVGKTGSKEALRLALSTQGTVAATAGNLNNHWGLPLSLARMPAATTWGVFELGMNHPGELAPLSRLARPDVALVTTVEAVHSEFFTTVEAIADAKAEIFAGVEPGGAAVLNRDNPYFARLEAAAAAAGVDRVVSFATDAAADVRLIEAEATAEGSRIVAMVDGRRLAYRLGVAGRHWVVNSLGVLAAVLALGADIDGAAAALAGLEAPKGRGRTIRVAVPGGAVTVVDESYNASPVSMRAAIATLGERPVGRGGRRIAVLGDMLELGPEAPKRHAALASALEAAGIDRAFTAGRLMGYLWDALPRPMRGGHAADARAVAALVVAAAEAGDVVMVKGSAGSRMGAVVDALMALDNEVPASRRAANGD